MKKAFRAPALMAAAALAATALAAAPALAAPVGDGTASVADLYNPTVTVGAPTSTYNAKGSTFTISGTGEFANLSGLGGSMAGTLTFSDLVGTTLPETVANFFTFNDGKGGNYDFSVASVKTQSFTTRS